ncbi:MAG: YbjN domain-containing protein [Jatrophihabitantaceae bacterium]
MTGPLQRAAGRVYGENGWPATELDDGSGFTLYIEGSEGAWSALALTDDDAHTFVFYSLAPVDAPPDGTDRMAEYLHRANHGLVSATFEFAYGTGEVRLRSGIELGTLPAELLTDDDMLQSLILDLSAANVGIFERYLSGIIAITLGDVSPAEIIGDIEGPIAELG